MSSPLFLIIFGILSLILSGCFPAVITGTTATVAEFAKDRPASDTIKDIKISSSIKSAFVKKSFRELYTKIKIEVLQGRVLYTGTVDNNEDIINAVQIAWDQEGVNEVINELKIDKNSSHFNIVQYTRDTLITSQIKSKVFMDRSIKFINYTVITTNDIVYLFGIARSEEELQKVANIASNIHGVEKVISHVRVGELAKKIKPSQNYDALLINDEDYVEESGNDNW